MISNRSFLLAETQSAGGATPVPIKGRRGIIHRSHADIAVRTEPGFFGKWFLRKTHSDFFNLPGHQEPHGAILPDAFKNAKARSPHAARIGILSQILSHFFFADSMNSRISSSTVCEIDKPTHSFWNSLYSSLSRYIPTRVLLVSPLRRTFSLIFFASTAIYPICKLFLSQPKCTVKYYNYALDYSTIT